MNLQINAAEIKTLLPMPEVVIKLNEVAFDPDVNPSEIARIIELDVALTTDVLRWANSPWSAAQVAILTIKDAVIRFGVSNILKLAIGKHISKPMKAPIPGYNLAEQELWRHSVAAALVTECLPLITSRPVPRAAFTTALLHDIGKLVLVRHLDPETNVRIRKLIEQENLSYFKAEESVLGGNHAQVGKMIAETWKLPDPITRAIGAHHNLNEHSDPLLDTIQVANAVTKLLGIGLGTEGMNLEINSEVGERVGLTPQTVDHLCTLVDDRLEETEDLWGFVS